MLVLYDFCYIAIPIKRFENIKKIHRSYMSMLCYPKIVANITLAKMRFYL